MTIPVDFTYYPGLPEVPFDNAWLIGTWTADGRSSDQQTRFPMGKILGEDDCPAFRATVGFDPAEAGRTFRWKIIVDTPGGPNSHGIATETNEPGSSARYRCFTLETATPKQEYHLSLARRLGANKFRPTGAQILGIRFSVWAPNARKVEVALADPATRYVANDGTGVTALLPMTRNPEGVWDTDSAASPALQRYADFVGKPYYFKITRDDGTIAYRTDLYSRLQSGCGNIDPKGERYSGPARDLDGAVSASIVVDPDLVCSHFDGTDPEARMIPAREFWANEFSPLKPLPSRIEDLIIYQLHVGALGFGRPGPGTLADALRFIDHLEALNVNAVQLLPLNEFSGSVGMGYGTTHFFAVEHSAGGRDQFKHFVRECHRRGIAVIMDVVYNHYPPEAERAQWQFDSTSPERNIWYWYEGSSTDYPSPDGGYIDNISSGFAPRFCEEQVRRCFTSSAVALAVEFHVDGFRMDQVTSLHSYAVIHANGHAAEHARIFGIKFLREWNRTLRLIKPSIATHAEDHSLWSQVTAPTSTDGLGFDAFWYADFYHHLVGGSDKGADYAKLLRMCGEGNDLPQGMNLFAGALYASGNRTIVYAAVHDHAGNAAQSARNMELASNGAPLIGDTRRFAEARCRFAFGMTMLSAGTPLFFMGEEVGAVQRYTYDTFLHHREDLDGLRQGAGAAMFRFTQDLIRFSRRNAVTRSREIDILHVNNDTRVIAFRRWQGPDQLLVVGSLNNRPFPEGYGITCDRLPDGVWREVFNSDAWTFGGWNTGNAGGRMESRGGRFSAVLPACGFLVFRKVA